MNVLKTRKKSVTVRTMIIAENRHNEETTC